MMIRKLAENDRKLTLDFLGEEPAINLFTIGDIEAFGFDKDFQELWGQFDSDDELEGVLLRFHESHIPYWKKDNFDATEFKRIINSYDGDIIMSGKESVIAKLNDILPEYKRKKTYFCELKEKENLKLKDLDIINADTSDCEVISSFLDTIEEFSDSSSTVEKLAQKIETNTGRVYYMKDNNEKILTVSQTSAENSKSAMVTGVATHVDERGKGLMTACLSKLCSDVLDEGKTLCLFYDNPKAGSVYHKLGFEAIDKWVMAVKEDKF